MNRIRTLRPCLLTSMLLAVWAFMPVAAQAQQAEAAVSAPVTVDTLALVTPVLQPAQSLLNGNELAPASAATFNADAMQNRVRAGSDVAMMGVGAAALVAGLLIGGDSGMIIATGGAVIGLVGLYRYLR